MDNASEPKAGDSVWPLVIRVTAYALATALLAYAGLCIYRGTDSALAKFFSDLFSNNPGEIRSGPLSLFDSLLTLLQWGIPAALITGQARRLARRIEIGTSRFRREEQVERRLDRLKWAKQERALRERPVKKSSGTVSAVVLGWIIGKLW